MFSISSKHSDNNRLLSQMNVNRFTSGVSIEGVIISNDCTFFDGKLVGNIILNQRLVLGENAFITGNIYAEELVVLGNVIGNIQVKGLAKFGNKSSFKGKILSQRIEIKEGAIFNAQCNALNSDFNFHDFAFFDDTKLLVNTKTIPLNTAPFLDARAYFS